MALEFVLVGPARRPQSARRALGPPTGLVADFESLSKPNIVTHSQSTGFGIGTRTRDRSRTSMSPCIEVLDQRCEKHLGQR